MTETETAVEPASDGQEFTPTVKSLWSAGPGSVHGADITEAMAMHWLNQMAKLASVMDRARASEVEARKAAEAELDRLKPCLEAEHRARSKLEADLHVAAAKIETLLRKGDG